MSNSGHIIHDDEVFSEIAYLYVNVCGHNATRTIKTYIELHPGNWQGHDPSLNGGNSSRYIKNNPKIMEYIKQYEEENREQLQGLRQANIDALSEIAYTPTRNTSKDRIAAMKELNNMMGYNTQNVNVNGNLDASIEVVIE